MANKIVLKKSSVVGKEPLITDLEYGELALNYADGRLYFKTADNQIDSFATGGGGSGFVTEAFRTFAVPGQTSIIADTATDTLTLSAQKGIEITTDSSSDTIYIKNKLAETFDIVARSETVSALLSPLLQVYMCVDRETLRDQSGLVVTRSGNLMVTG